MRMRSRIINHGTASEGIGKKGKATAIAIIITIIVLVAGSAAFFLTGAYKQEMKTDTIFDSIRLKAGYTEGGDIKLFAYARSDELRRYPSIEGKNLPSEDSMVIGYAEANMMREEALFSAIGDQMTGFFGIDTRIGGILAQTNTTLDDMHFLGKDEFESIEGEDDRVFVERTAEGMPKFFYRMDIGEKTPLRITVKEGSAEGYAEKEIDGKKYLPLLLGAREASMMREEKLFGSTGETIDGFFGKDVVIIGILEETGTAIDMMHIIPATEEELG